MPDYKKRTRFTELSLETQLVLWKHHFRSLWIPVWFAQSARSKREFEKMLEPVKKELRPDDEDSKEFWIIAAEVWQAFKANQASFIEILQKEPMSLATAMIFSIQKGVFNTPGDGEISFHTYEQILKNLGEDLSDLRIKLKYVDNFQVRTPRLEFRLYVGEVSARRASDGWVIKCNVELIPFPDERFSLRSAIVFLKFLEEIRMPTDYNTEDLAVSSGFALHQTKASPYAWWQSSLYAKPDIYPVLRLTINAVQPFEAGKEIAVGIKYSNRGWILNAIQSALGVEVVEA